MVKVDLKDRVKNIIEKLTENRQSIFLEHVYMEACELGISENYVAKAIEELKQEKYVEPAFNNKVIKRLSLKEN